ncbi:MAG: hypothetical protein IPI30_16040 [Saprospiraceae bacterium]|nr:hypothetical protein [Candidatus Vicinibacter affinis]
MIKNTEYVLKKIRKLYLIEQRARDENMNIESRKDLRKEAKPFWMK